MSDAPNGGVTHAADPSDTIAQAGKQLEDPSDMSTTETRETDAQDAQAPAQQIEDFQHMKSRQTGFNRFTVTNLSSGTAYQVRLGGENGIECDCPDHKYNRDSDEFDACKHVLYASFQAPAKLDQSEWMMQQFGALFREAQDAVARAEDAAEAMDTALVRTREMEAESVPAQTDERPSLEETTPEPTHDPQEKADELKAAYDDVVDDMQVTVGDGGCIWVQTGRDTPDELDGPGNVSVFEAFLKGPEQVEYVHDDHPAATDRPGKWWKNRIEPGKVDQYISEVL